MKKDVELVTLFSKVRRQEEQNRLRVFIPLGILLISLGADVLLAYMWYSQIVAVVIFLSGVLGFWLLVAEGLPDLTVSEDFVARRLDSALNLRGRISTLMSLQVAHDDEKTLQREVLERQIGEMLSERSWNEKEIAPFTNARLQEWSWMAIVIAATCFFALLYFKPITIYDAAVQTIEKVLAKNPQLPESVRIEAERLIELLENENISVDNVLSAATDVESLVDSIAQQMVSLGNQETIQSSSGRHDINARRVERDNKKKSPQPQPQHADELDSPPSHQENQSGEDSQENQPEQGIDKQKEEQAERRDGGTEQQGSQDIEREKSEGREKKEGAGNENSTLESEAEEADSAEKQDGDGKEEEESGNSQGESKQDSGAQGAAHQEGAKQQGTQQQGVGEGAGNGKGEAAQGEGEDENGSGSSTASEGIKGSAPQRQGGSKQDGNKSGEQGFADQEEASGGTSVKEALNQIKSAVSDIKEKLEQDKKSEQNQDSKSSSAQGGSSKEEKQGEAPTLGGGEESQQGSGENDSQEDSDNKDSSEEQSKDKSDKNSDQKSSGDERDNNKGGTSDEQKKSDAEKSKKSKEKTGDNASSQRQDREQSEQKKAGDKPSEGSFSPDVNRDAKPRPGGYDEQKSRKEGLAGDPSRFKEILREAKDEQLTTDQTAGDAQIVENQEQAKAKTSLEDISLAKPKPSAQRESQPIPLEYRSLLEKQ